MDSKDLGRLIGDERRDPANDTVMKEYTLCVITDDNNRHLLKYATRGICEGKWNFLGGKVDDGETLLEGVKREIYEESGLSISDAFYHGKIDYYHGPEDQSPMRVHIFSSKSITGTIKSGEEGEVVWFDSAGLPVDKMWKDKALWLDLIYAREKFDITVIYNNRNGDQILSSSIKILEEKRKTPTNAIKLRAH